MWGSKKWAEREVRGCPTMGSASWDKTAKICLKRLAFSYWRLMYSCLLNSYVLCNILVPTANLKEQTTVTVLRGTDTCVVFSALPYRKLFNVPFQKRIPVLYNGDLGPSHHWIYHFILILTWLQIPKVLCGASFPLVSRAFLNLPNKQGKMTAILKA